MRMFSKEKWTDCWGLLADCCSLDKSELDSKCWGLAGLGRDAPLVFKYIHADYFANFQHPLQVRAHL